LQTKKLVSGLFSSANVLKIGELFDLKIALPIRRNIPPIKAEAIVAAP
jgi:hypothetical protein